MRAVLPAVAPRGKAFGVFRLTHVATAQPLSVDCRNCGGDEFSVEGGPCPACKGTGRHAVRKPLPTPDVLRATGEWLELTEAQQVANAIDWRLGPFVTLVDRVKS